MHDPVSGDQSRPQRKSDDARRMVEARMSANRVSAPPGTQEACEELDGHLEQQRALNELARLASETSSVSSYADELARRLAETLGVGFITVLELDPCGEQFTLRSAFGFDRKLVGKAKVPADARSQSGYTRISPQPVVVVEDVAREKRDFSPAPLIRKHGIVSSMTVTVRSGGTEWGVIGVHSQRKRSFSAHDQTFLADAAWWLGNVVQRRRSHGEARSYEEGFGFISDACAALALAGGDAEAKLETAARLAVGAIADVCFVDIVEASPDGTSPAAIRRFGASFSEDSEEEVKETVRGLASHYPLSPATPHGTPKVLNTGQPEFIPEVRPEILEAAARDAKHLKLLNKLDPKSYMNVPIRLGLRTIGTIVFVSCSKGERPARRYGEADLRLASGLARCTALAIADVLDGLTTARKKNELAQITKSLAEEGPRVVEDPTPTEKPRLPSRQLEILKLMAQGLSDTQIAKSLFISKYTVKNHRTVLQKALKANSKLEAVRNAQHLGLLSAAGLAADD